VVLLKVLHAHSSIALPTIGDTLNIAPLHGTVPALGMLLDIMRHTVVADVHVPRPGAKETCAGVPRAVARAPRRMVQTSSLLNTAGTWCPRLLVQLPGIVHASVHQPGHNRPVPLLPIHSYPQMVVVLVEPVDAKHVLVVLVDHVWLGDVHVFLVPPVVSGYCVHGLVPEDGAGQHQWGVVIPLCDYLGLVREDNGLVVAPGLLLELVHRCQRRATLDMVLSDGSNVLDVLLHQDFNQHV
jgi:hypothetical protein